MRRCGFSGVGWVYDQVDHPLEQNDNACIVTPLVSITS